METVKEKKTVKKWTKEEEQIVIENVRKYPTNLAHAFSESALQLEGRAPASISALWYDKLRKRDDVQAITIGSSKGYSQNAKNTLRKDGVMGEQGLKGYMIVVRDLLNLPKKDRDLVISFLQGAV